MHGATAAAAGTLAQFRGQGLGVLPNPNLNPKHMHGATAAAAGTLMQFAAVKGAK